MKHFKQFLDELVKYKEYIIYSIRSDLKLSLSGSYLGYLWWILDPIMYMLVYVLVVSVIFDRGGREFPVFVFSALLTWKWVSQVTVRNTNSIKSKAPIISQVYVPKSILPFIQNVVALIYFIFGLVALFMLIPFFGVGFTWHILEFPLIILVTFIFVFGVGLNLAHLGVYFKDINNILNFTIRLWFYLSPGLYSIKDIPEKIRFLWWFNPMTTIYISTRNIVMYNQSPLYFELLIILLLSLVLVWRGLKTLHKFDSSYTKYT